MKIRGTQEIEMNLLEWINQRAVGPIRLQQDTGSNLYENDTFHSLGGQLYSEKFFSRYLSLSTWRRFHLDLSVQRTMYHTRGRGACGRRLLKYGTNWIGRGQNFSYARYWNQLIFYRITAITPPSRITKGFLMVQLTQGRRYTIHLSNTFSSNNKWGNEN